MLAYLAAVAVILGNQQISGTGKMDDFQ